MASLWLFAVFGALAGIGFYGLVNSSKGGSWRGIIEIAMVGAASGVLVGAVVLGSLR